jgi:hypothetical protein
MKKYIILAVIALAAFIMGVVVAAFGPDTHVSGTFIFLVVAAVWVATGQRLTPELWSRLKSTLLTIFVAVLAMHVVLIAGLATYFYLKHS